MTSFILTSLLRQNRCRPSPTAGAQERLLQSGLVEAPAAGHLAHGRTELRVSSIELVVVELSNLATWEANRGDVESARTGGHLHFRLYLARTGLEVN
jgi:hypothetical protein